MIECRFAVWPMSYVVKGDGRELLS